MRKNICNSIRYELREGEHTLTMCRCGRHSSSGEMCWECWLDILERGKENEN
jgi:hypothetical protein